VGWECGRRGGRATEAQEGVWYQDQDQGRHIAANSDQGARVREGGGMRGAMGAV